MGRSAAHHPFDGVVHHHGARLVAHLVPKGDDAAVGFAGLPPVDHLDGDGQRVADEDRLEDLHLYAQKGQSRGVQDARQNRQPLGHKEVPARLDALHYKFPAKAGGTSGCSTDHMKSIIEFADSGLIDLAAFPSRDIFYLEDLEDNPASFFEYKGLKPILSPHPEGVERRKNAAKV